MGIILSVEKLIEAGLTPDIIVQLASAMYIGIDDGAEYSTDMEDWMNAALILIEHIPITTAPELRDLEWTPRSCGCRYIHKWKDS